MTGGRTAVALAWTSASHVIKAYADGYYLRQISRQDVVMVISMDFGTSWLGSVLLLVTNSNGQL